MIRLFRARNFRCLESVELQLAAKFNLVVGPNASGKTSLLEALAYLGRGKSFRGATTSTVLRHGASEFTLFGEVEQGKRVITVGAGNGRDGLEVRIDGVNGSGSAALAEALPLQVIDPEVHNLISGGPELRRRYLDWVGFHVEHDHLQHWRRFRRALKQRNAALRAGAAAGTIESWNHEFVDLSMALDAARQRVLQGLIGRLTSQGERLLQTVLAFEYKQGWSRDRSLAEALEEGIERDRALGTTQSGPHRADLKVSYDERQARKLVSRGQQKLLASAMILAAAETAQTALGRPMLLLLDDPAAELDEESLRRLLASVAALDCQVVATALNQEAVRFPEPPKLFHVEQGAIREFAIVSNAENKGARNT